jgi:hypothetical protein
MTIPITMILVLSIAEERSHQCHRHDDQGLHRQLLQRVGSNSKPRSRTNPLGRLPSVPPTILSEKPRNH